MSRRRRIQLVLLGCLALAGCSYLQDDPSPYRTPVYYGGDAAAPANPGMHLYLRDCAYCHGDDGKGTTRAPDITGGTNGPALTDFVLRTGRMPVEGPIDQMSPGPRVYDQAQIDAIVGYMRQTFRPPGPEIPDIRIDEGELGEGQQLYAEHCASCHATTGIGGAMLIQAGEAVPGKARGIKIPNLEDSDPHAVAEAVRTGPGSMPVFGERAISDEELQSLVRYVEYLRSPSDKGGAPIGRVGPVLEGAVGWLVGLGALMVFIRWIGTKAGEI